MSEHEIDPDSDEFCQMAFEEAQNMCATPEMAFTQAARFMGFTTEEIDDLLPFDEKSTEILGEGLTGDTCGDIYAIRKWIVARAWDAHTAEGYTIFEAFQMAWAEAMGECFG
jgi:hypothetical protein